MVSKRDVLTVKYNLLRDDIRNSFSNQISDIFVPLEDLDLADVIFLICTTFTDESQYKEIIVNMIRNNRIEMVDADINRLVVVITPYINFSKNYQ